MRTTTNDAIIGGQQVKKGGWIYLSCLSIDGPTELADVHMTR